MKSALISKLITSYLIYNYLTDFWLNAEYEMVRDAALNHDKNH